VVIRTAAATATSATVNCTAGEKAFGGGGSAAIAGGGDKITGSFPVVGTTPAPNGATNADGWRVTANNAVAITVYVVCGS
jgi:hypothetical protein